MGDPCSFVGRFGRQPVMSCSELWCITEPYSRYEWESYLQKRVTPVDTSELSWWDVLSPKQRGYKLQYDDMVSEKVRLAKVAPDLQWIYDLDHSPSGQAHMGYTSDTKPKPLSTIISHSTSWHVEFDRWLHGLEKLVAHCYQHSLRILMH